LLLRAIDSLYRQFGLYTSKPKGYPTVADVRSWLGRYKSKGREAGWMESSVRAIETLCFGEVGNVLNSEPFFDIPKLLEKTVILELDALTNTDKTFLIESLLLWIHHYRMAQDSREQFKHAIIIEEAHHILLRKKQEATGEETVTDVLLREIRELGESVICLDQHPSLISKPALGNTYTTFAMNLKHRGDIAMIQDSLLLNSEQAGFLGRLEVGWAIVRLQGRWFWPFLVKLPEMDIRKGVVTDARLKKITGQTQKDFYLPVRSSKRCTDDILTKEGKSGLSGNSKEGYRGALTSDKRDFNEGKEVTLTTQEKLFLDDVYTHQLSTISTDNGGFKGLLLTDKGEKALGKKPTQSNRAGGPEHKFWLRATAQHLRRQGFAVTEEAPVGNGKTIDVLAVKDGGKTAFEIETGKSDAAGNVEKCLNAKIERIVVVTTSITADNKVKNSLAGIPQVQIIRAAEAIQRKW